MPMPLDVLVNYTDGSQEMFYIPITLMRGEKENPYTLDWKVLPDWSWSHPEYSLMLKKDKSQVESIIIDPTFLMADVDRSDNYYSATEEK